MAPRGPLPFTPLHLEDETLYSHLGRVNAYSCWTGSSRRFLHDVFGDMKAVSSADLPSRLSSMLERWPEVSPYPTVDAVIEKATQYPYHRPFMPAERWKELVRRATRGPGSSLKTWLGLVAHRFSASATFRSCIECDRLSWDTEGVIYWHRAHMLPGVVICPIHHTPLVNHFVQSEDSARSALRLPPLAGTPVILAHSSLGPLTRFSTTSRDALCSADADLNGELSVAIYRARLKESGLCSTSGRVRWAELSSLILEANDEFRGWPVGGRIAERTGRVLGWLYGLLRDRERLCHPLTHIVLINLLFGSFDAYAAAARAQQTDLVDGARRPKDSDPAPCFVIANCDVSCRAAALELGVSVTTVVKRRRALGLPISERRKILTLDRLTFIRQRLATGAAPAQVADEAHLSLSSVYRIRSEMGYRPPRSKTMEVNAIASYRKRWANTGLISSSVRQRRVLDGAAYAWLYRHDREWLTTGPGRRSSRSTGRTVRHSRIDWERRDERYALRIAAVAADRDAQFPRKRLSISALLREAGPQSSMRVRLYRLPRTREALRTYSESVESFQEFRYEQALAGLVDSAGFFQQWKALKLAGLRRPPDHQTNSGKKR